MRSGALIAAVALLAAACGSGLSAQQAEVLARQTRTSTAGEFWGVYGEVTPAIHRSFGDYASGGFGRCPGVSQDNLVSYGISAYLFPENQGTTGGAHALLQDLQPMLRAHGWGRWQSMTGSLNDELPEPYVVSKQRGYTLYLQVQPQGDGDISVLLLLGGPCVAVGAPEATALVTQYLENGYQDDIDISPGSARHVPTSPLPTPTS